MIYHVLYEPSEKCRKYGPQNIFPPVATQHIGLNVNLRKKLIKCYIWSMPLYGAETWTLQAADQKYLESFEMWCLRRMEKISWTDHVRNEEVLFRVNEQRNILHEIRKRKANGIDNILRRNCLLKQVIEGKIKGEMEVAR